MAPDRRDEINGIVDSNLEKRRWFWFPKVAGSCLIASASLSALVFTSSVAYENVSDQNNQNEILETLKTEIKNPDYDESIYYSNDTIVYKKSQDEDGDYDDCVFGWGDVDPQLSDVVFFDKTETEQIGQIIATFADEDYFVSEGSGEIDAAVVSFERVAFSDFSGVQIMADTIGQDPVVEFLKDTDEALKDLNDFLAQFCQVP